MSDHLSPEDALALTFRHLLAELPFDSYVWHTGGGCMAIVVPTLTGYLMLTSHDEGTLSERDWSEGRWDVGHYRTIGDDEGYYMLTGDDGAMRVGLGSIVRSFIDDILPTLSEDDYS